MVMEKPSTEHILLGSLMQGPRHGYEIMRFLDSALSAAWQISRSQLYTLMKKMEKDKLLESSVELQVTRPSKRVFKITERGKKSFLAWLSSPTDHVRDFRLEFIGKLFFYHKLSLRGALELIEAQIRVLDGVRQRLLKEKKDESDPFNILVYDFKLETVKGQIRWLSRSAKSNMTKANRGNKRTVSAGKR
jgi:DNA-binding PadR family transcriptional regulator